MNITQQRSIAEIINGARLAYLQVELLATDAQMAQLAARRIYSDARGMWRAVMAEARRQHAGMVAAGYSADRPYRVRGRHIHACSTAYPCGHGLIR